MLIVVVSLIIGAVFGFIAAAVVLAVRQRFSPAVGIVGAAGFVAGFVITVIFCWFSQPVIGSILLGCFFGGGIVIAVLSRLFSRSFGRMGRSATGIISLVLAGGLLLTGTYFGVSSAIWRGYDQAKYFDSILEFPTGDMPFNNMITGDHLRVVDSDLAAEIILKQQPFGSNSMIQELHVGKLNGELMWIGVIGSDAIQIGTDNAGRKRNTIFGFVGVDLTDPSQDVVVVEQSFKIGHYLARQKNLDRIIWKINANYRAGDNSYFSMDDGGIMRLLVPYSIAQNWKIEGDLGMSTYLEKVGGVLEFDSEGNLIKDYKDLSELPDYARIQCYPEDWLEFNINKWGRHRKGDHEFAYWFTTTEQLGISWYDDVRVIYDANTEETSQYIMLTQPESESQLLRGAIKANSTGIFFFDWSDLDRKPIDTYSALEHCASAIDLERGTTAHDYHPILPLLYPIRTTHNDIRDYAYVVPIQFGDIRFGGVCITDPFDPLGDNTTVKITETAESVEEMLDQALVQYLDDFGGGAPFVNNFTEILHIDQLASFEQDGNTIFVAQGNLTYIPEGENTTISENNTVWFSQEYLNVTQWQLVLFLEVGDILTLEVVVKSSIFYCLEIETIT
ncbi:MAG: threonine/serine exporter [Asgard group archaeon]|nr:threonine/serine exporter [Asgard group archaeon]